MEFAMSGEESAIVDFAAFLLNMLEYDEPDRSIHKWRESSFVMCGTVVDANPSVCVSTEYSEYAFLAQEAKARPPFLFHLPALHGII